MTDRSEVYKALDGERDYQKVRWSEDTTSTGGFHSVTEFLVYMQDYVNEALHNVSREADPGASEKALHWVRKVGALAVACMEQHGAPERAKV